MTHERHSDAPTWRAVAILAWIRFWPWLVAIGGGLLVFGCLAAAANAQPIAWALKPGVVSRDVSDAQLRLPTVAGLTIRVPFAELNPRAGVYAFAEIDQNIAQAKRCGKPVKLIVQTGRDLMPAWIGGDWGRYQGQEAPLPWSPQLADANASLVERLGRQYPNAFAAVHVTGPTWPSAEMHPMPGLESVPGYSDARMVAAWRSAIDAYAAAFPAADCCLSLSVQKPANRYVEPVIAYAKSRLGRRFVLQHNALKANTPATAPHHALLLKHQRAGVRVSFEMVDSAVNAPSRVGSRNINDALRIGRAAGAEWIDVYPPDLGGVK